MGKSVSDQVDFISLFSLIVGPMFIAIYVLILASYALTTFIVFPPHCCDKRRQESNWIPPTSFKRRLAFFRNLGWHLLLFSISVSPLIFAIAMFMLYDGKAVVLENIMGEEKWMRDPCQFLQLSVDLSVYDYASTLTIIPCLRPLFDPILYMITEKPLHRLPWNIGKTDQPHFNTSVTRMSRSNSSKHQEIGGKAEEH